MFRPVSEVRLRGAQCTRHSWAPRASSCWFARNTPYSYSRLFTARVTAASLFELENYPPVRGPLVPLLRMAPSALAGRARREGRGHEAAGSQDRSGSRHGRRVRDGWRGSLAGAWLTRLGTEAATRGGKEMLKIIRRIALALGTVAAFAMAGGAHWRVPG